MLCDGCCCCCCCDPSLRFHHSLFHITFDVRHTQRIEVTSSRMGEVKGFRKQHEQEWPSERNLVCMRLCGSETQLNEKDIGRFQLLFCQPPLGSRPVGSTVGVTICQLAVSHTTTTDPSCTK